jgi:hypothetical protein
MTGLKIMCSAVALLSSTSAFAQAGSWSVSEASGRVVIRTVSGDRSAQRGSQVPAGATLLTGSAARAVLVRGEDFVTVAPNSRLRVPTAEQATGLFQMIEEWGNAVFRIKHLPKPHFAVQTPYLAAVVKGTTFSVTVNGDGTSLQVIDGAVEVATTDGRRPLPLVGAGPECSRDRLAATRNEAGCQRARPGHGGARSRSASGGAGPTGRPQRRCRLERGQQQRDRSADRGQAG